jgi:hypothetical protein
MANYTLELRTLIDNDVKIFNFNYPFYDETKKTEFEDAFVLHFKYREICCYPVNRWIDMVHDTFNTKLPFYNELFATEQIEYNKTQNYNITETQERTTTGESGTTTNAIQSGNSTGTATNTNALTHTDDSTVTDSKTNTLNSNTDHTENNTFTKDETLDESSTNTKDSSKNLDALQVKSDTPENLVSVTNIKGNVYASSAERGDNTETSNDTEEITAKKTDKNTETTDRTTNDKVTGSSTDTSTDTVHDESHDNSNGTANTTSNFGNTADTTQSTTNSNNENYTRTMKGSYGVITEADMLQKHIALQTVLKTSLSKFFDECENLFMQVFEMEGI